MTTTETTTYAPLTVGTVVVVHKGCAPRQVSKGARATVLEVTPGERGSAKVRLAFNGGTRVLSFYVQHTNRLADLYPAMNDGNPLHRIQVRRV